MNLVDILVWIDVNAFEGGIIEDREDVERGVKWKSMEPCAGILAWFNLDGHIRTFFVGG